MQITVKVDQVKQLMCQAMHLRGISCEDAEFIADDYLEAEQLGHGTHGVSKFLMLDTALKNRGAGVEIVVQKSCFAKLDGHGELGHIAGRQAAQLCISLAKSQGIGIVAVHNISRYSRLTPYARLIAEEGLVGILSNNGGPACVVPYGGKRPLFGTNPLCFGFPGGKKSPYVFDFSTAQQVWGRVRECIVKDEPLPEDCFLDAQGEFTTDPLQAEAVIPFGGPKGYALCCALEILTGAMIGTKMGSEPQDEFDLGYLFVAISPDVFTDTDVFRQEVEKLAQAIRSCPPMDKNRPVRIPGEASAARLAAREDPTTMELDSDVLRRLNQMSVSKSGGYEDNKQMN